MWMSKAASASLGRHPGRRDQLGTPGAGRRRCIAMAAVRAPAHRRARVGGYAPLPSRATHAAPEPGTPSRLTLARSSARRRDSHRPFGGWHPATAIQVPHQGRRADSHSAVVTSSASDVSRSRGARCTLSRRPMRFRGVPAPRPSCRPSLPSQWPWAGDGEMLSRRVYKKVKPA
jgi:hypothetical protein